MTGGTVVAAARGWLGTRWQHQGRTKGVGVDCVGLILGVARELRLVDVEVSGYGRLPDGSLLARARAHLAEVAFADARPGDVLAMRFDGEPQHVALLAEAGGTPTVIHAHARARRVVEHRLDDLWRSRVVAVFRLPGVA